MSIEAWFVTMFSFSYSCIGNLNQAIQMFNRLRPRPGLHPTIYMHLSVGNGCVVSQGQIIEVAVLQQPQATDNIQEGMVSQRYTKGLNVCYGCTLFTSYFEELQAAGSTLTYNLASEQKDASKLSPSELPPVLAVGGFNLFLAEMDWESTQVSCIRAFRRVQDQLGIVKESIVDTVSTDLLPLLSFSLGFRKCLRL